jgi:hypothetical protein
MWKANFLGFVRSRGLLEETNCDYPISLLCYLLLFALRPLASVSGPWLLLISDHVWSLEEIIGLLD